MEISTLSLSNCIRLDARIHSDLDWKEPIKQAEKLFSEGKKVLWEMDFGLFDHVSFPLDNESQFLSLTLAIQHFKDKITLPSLGVVIYKGPLLHGEEEEYLSLLETHFPDDIQTFLLFDLFGENNLLRIAELFSKEKFPRSEFGIKGTDFPHTGYQWDGEKLYKNLNEIKTGLCLPEERDLSLTPIIQDLIDRSVNFRVIPELSLFTEWEGLDEIITIHELMSPEGKRMLQGFEAAGGKILPKNI